MPWIVEELGKSGRDTRTGDFRPQQLLARGRATKRERKTFLVSSDSDLCNLESQCRKTGIENQRAPCLETFPR